ncbi:MAG: hypothetical protein IJ518_07840 [Clostridia bacterium]|nr:hypothetical protein [Clostridia bacterium]
MKKWLRHAAGLLAACILLSCTVLAAEEDGQPEEPAGTVQDAALPDENYTRVAADGALELYLDEEEGAILLRDVAGGTLWYSTPADVKEEKLAKGVFKMSLYSLVTLNVIDSATNSASASTLTSYTECVLSDGGVEYAYLDNGFTVSLKFVDYGITVPLSVTLQDGALCVAVDTAGIKETTATWVKSLTLLPYFGAGNSQAEGFMLVPDGSGALIRFNNGKTAAAFYENELYGADLSKVSTTNKLVTQQSYLPVFGLQSGNSGYLAVVDGAAANAAVHAEVAGKRTSYNGVSAVFTLRDASVVSIGDNQITDYEERIKDIGSLSVRYYFYANGGGYSEMASLYRTYLQKEQGLTASATNTGAYLQVLNSVPQTQSFLGFDYLRQQATTTYDETVTMLDTLQKAGMNHLSVVLKNWDTGSVKETITKRVQVSGALGGKKAFSRLMSYGEKAGIPLYLTTRTVAYRQGGLFAGFRDAARSIENVSIRRYAYSLSTSREDLETRPQYLLSPTRLMDKVTVMAKNFAKKERTHIAVDDLATMLYADYTRSASTTKSGSVGYITKALASLQEQEMTMVSEGANAYALPYLQAVLGAPASHSGYDIEDEAVPFYQLVLNGLIDYTTPALNLSSDGQDLFLWALESGSRPLYVLAQEGENLEGAYSRYYSIAYDGWTATAAAQYAAFREIWDKTDGMAIASHQLVAKQVALVTYKNGATLLVNRSANRAETPYGTVEAESYVFTEGA